MTQMMLPFQNLNVATESDDSFQPFDYDTPILSHSYSPPRTKPNTNSNAKAIDIPYPHTIGAHRQSSVEGCNILLDVLLGKLDSFEYSYRTPPMDMVDPHSPVFEDSGYESGSDSEMTESEYDLEFKLDFSPQQFEDEKEDPMFYLEG